MPLIQTDPDDTELRNAIGLVEKYKKLYESADKAWRERQTATYPHDEYRDAWDKAKARYESALVNLALIIMERL